MPRASRFRSWLRTARAAGLLCCARLLIAVLPFGLWRRGIGPHEGRRQRQDPDAARRLAAHVERAAWRLPFTVKCLPQAMALSWQLRRRGIAHSLVLAVRPPAMRGGDDALHAWVECNGRIVLGELPGPWIRLTAPPGS